MADVVKRSETPQRTTAKALSHITTTINQQYKSTIYSPLTMILGDELQDMVAHATTGLAITIAIEEPRIEEAIPFQLRYVFIKGAIETPINTKIAYGLLGKGLTKARALLDKNQKKRARFLVKCGSHDNALNKLLFLYHSLIADWPVKDYHPIHGLLQLGDYKVVDKENPLTPSLIWKRKKTCKIEEYDVLKSLLLDYV